MALGYSGHGNFRGKSGSDSKKKQKMSAKERAANRGTHKNKYAHLTSKAKRVGLVDPDKNIRELPLVGQEGEVFSKGLIIIFHGRRYRLSEDVVVPTGGRVYGLCTLVGLV